MVTPSGNFLKFPLALPSQTDYTKIKFIKALPLSGIGSGKFSGA